MIFTCLLTFKPYAQSWQPLGPDDFNQPSYVGSSSTALFRIDKNNNQWVAYVDENYASQATVSKLVNGKWTVQGVRGFTPSTFIRTDFLIDNDGNPWVSFSDATSSKKATVMKLENGTWVVKGTSGFSAGELVDSRLAIDRNGDIWIVYRETGVGNRAMANKFENGTWVSKGQVSTGNMAYASIDFDSSNTPWVSYTDFTSGSKVSVVKLDNGSWVPVGGSLGVTAGQSYFTNILFDDSNYAWFTYQDSRHSNKAGLFRFENGAWVDKSPNGITSGEAYDIRMSIDANQVLWLSYKDYANGKKTSVMKYENGAWSVVGSLGFSFKEAYATSKVQFDNSNTPYVAVSDLGLAYKTNIFKLVSGTWVSQSTTSISATYGDLPFLSVDKDDNPWIVYSDYSNVGKGMVKKFVNGAWVMQGDSGFGGGQILYPSLGFNKQGEAFVCFNSGKAIISKLVNGVWTPLGNTDISSGFAYYPSMTFDTAGNPVIAYGDFGNGTKLTVKKLVNGNWVTQGSAGFSAGQAYWSSIAIDKNNDPWVIYYDAANGNKATVMKLVNGTWTPLGVGISAGAVNTTKIKIDKDGSPWIIYKDGGNSDFVVVKKLVNGSWVNQGTNNPSAGAADYTSISMMFDSIPVIAYIDVVNHSAGTVRKLVNGTWTTIGSEGFSAGKFYCYNIAFNKAGDIIVGYSSSNIWAKIFYNCYTPIVNAHPAAKSICLNSSAIFNFNVTASRVTYQWQDSTSGHTWANISGATGSSYTFNNIPLSANNNKYRCIASNPCGSVTSNPALLIVYNCDAISNVASDWRTSSTWYNNAIPSSTTNVILNTNVVINSTASCNNLTINAGDTLSLTNGASLVINGDLVVNGYLKMTAGIITFTKPNTCIPSGTYHQLRLCAAGTIYACGTMIVNHDLVICSGTTFNDSGFVISAKADISNDGAHVTKNNGKIELVGTTVQTIYGTTGVYGNLDLNNSAGARLGANNSTTTPATINNTFRMASGSFAINGNTFTIGSTSNAVATILNPGNGTIIATLAQAHIKLLGNASAPLITNLRISTPGSVTLDRPNGVRLGTSSTIYSTLNMINGNINMAGSGLTIGNNSTASGNIQGSGFITNTGNSGMLSLLGNSSNGIYNNLKLDTMYNLYLNNAKGARLIRNCYIKSSAILNNGDINLNGYIVTLSPTASISENAGQNFYGTTGKLTTTINYTSAINYVNICGMGLNLATNNAPGVTTISRGHTVYSNAGNNSIKRYYDITTTNSVNCSYMSITYDSTELNNNPYNSLRINRSNTGGASWSSISGCTPAGSNTPIGTVSKSSAFITLNSTTAKFTASDLNHSLSLVFVNNNQTTNITSEPTQVTNNIYTYPNPFTNEFTVELNVNAGIYTIQLTDLNGRMIYNQNIETTEGTNKINISTETLSKGMYILNVIGNEQKQMMKIVKQ